MAHLTSAVTALKAAELLSVTGAASAKEFEQKCPCVTGFSTDTTTFLEIPQACERLFFFFNGEGVDAPDVKGMMQ